MTSSIVDSRYPSGLFARLRGKSVEELAREQGSRPFDIRSLDNAPGLFYEGFEEDIKRMRRGGAPFRPRDASLPGVLLDTNVVSFLSRPCREGKDYQRLLISRAPSIAVISLAELRYGALNGGWAEARWQQLEALIKPWTVIAADSNVAWQAARIMNASRVVGRRIEWADAWIAGTALAHDVPLMTHDSDFFEIEGLEVITLLPTLTVRCPETKRDGFENVTEEDALCWAQRYIAALESGVPAAVWDLSQRASSRATAR